MFAVITTGGKQYLVSEGQTLKVEKLEQAAGSPIEFGALLIAEADGSQVEVGKPQVAGATVKAMVVEHGRGEKVSIVKFKAKVRYRRRGGHRQPFTVLRVDKIVK